MTLRQRLLRTIMLVAIGLCLGGAIAALSLTQEQNSNSSGSFVNAAGVGGSYSLLDQDGKTRTDQDFKTSYKLIYFGFTYCPTICPTELQKISRALQNLSPEQSAKIQPLFITIDPERDTVAVLKKYIELFDYNLMALTGSPEQIEAVKKAYKVYAAKVPQGEDYTMDHSSFIYFMSPDDQLLAIFRSDDTAKIMSEKISATLN